MPDILMKRKHGFDDPEDVRSRIEGLAEKVSERMGGSWCWNGDEAVCKARGAEARVGYDADSINIHVSLPLMLRPLHKKLEAKIEEYYGRYFGQNIGDS